MELWSCGALPWNYNCAMQECVIGMPHAWAWRGLHLYHHVAPRAQARPLALYLWSWVTRLGHALADMIMCTNVARICVRVMACELRSGADIARAARARSAVGDAAARYQRPCDFGDDSRCGRGRTALA